MVSSRRCIHVSADIGLEDKKTVMKFKSLEGINEDLPGFIKADPPYRFNRPLAYVLFG